MLDNIHFDDAISERAGGRRPPDPPPFERIALSLRGGDALGAYQGGVYLKLPRFRGVLGSLYDYDVVATSLLAASNAMGDR